MQGLEFREKDHSYTYYGQKCISVTTLMKKTLFKDKYKNVNEATLKVASDKGVALHNAIEVYEKYGKSAIAVEEVPEEKIERYGIIGGEEVENGVININQLVEKPPRSVAPSNLAIMGRYFLTPDIFDHIENVEPGYGGEIQLTDALAKLDAIYGKVFVGESYDIGNRVDWLKTSLKFAMEDENSREDILDFIQNEIMK